MSGFGVNGAGALSPIFSIEISGSCIVYWPSLDANHSSRVRIMAQLAADRGHRRRVAEVVLRRDEGVLPLERHRAADIELRDSEFLAQLLKRPLGGFDFHRGFLQSLDVSCRDVPLDSHGLFSSVSIGKTHAEKITATEDLMVHPVPYSGATTL